MSKTKELIDKMIELEDKLNKEELVAKKTKQEIDTISVRIGELKEKEDYGSFKFVQSNMPLIIEKIAPKHKVPKEHEVRIASGGDKPVMIASIPWIEDKCSDKNPCNINVCPKCTLIHFHKVLDKLLAEYYVK